MKQTTFMRGAMFSAAVIGLAGLAGVSAERADALHTTDVSKHADHATQENKQVRLTDGTLIASPESGVFLLEEGEKHPIESAQVFKSYGYHFSNVKMITEEDLNSIPSTDPLPIASGSLVSPKGSPKVYVVENGMKRYVPSPKTLMDAGYTFDHVMTISQESADRHPTGDDYTDSGYIPNGSTVYADGTGAFVIQDNTRRPIPDRATFESNFGDLSQLRKVEKSDLMDVPAGDVLAPADRTLVADDNTVYLVEDGMKRPFKSVDQFVNDGFMFDRIKSVSMSVVNDLPVGADMDEKSVSMKETIAHKTVTWDKTSTLETAVKQADLVSVLDGSTEYTVFAPGDAAFDKLDDSTLTDLLKDENKSELQTLLKNHVVKGSVKASELMNKDTVTTLTGKELDVKVDGSTVMVGGVEVDMTDIHASNGIVHTVKSVIQ